MKINFFYINQQGEVLTMHCKKPIQNKDRAKEILKQSCYNPGQPGFYVIKEPVVYSEQLNKILN